jgi:asparagine synthase (glutamine-hydrolysing)
MCGIAGKLNIAEREAVTVDELAAMLAMIRHRGPDEFGVLIKGPVGLASARLSIIDLAGGRQPIHNEDRSVWVVLNGEIFNYRELRAELVAAGHVFYTETDTEVLVHLYEEQGAGFVKALNGQFAIALWDDRRHELLLIRDRVGIRPLYYTQTGGRLHFASEVKAIFADQEVSVSLDLHALAQAFTLWTTLSPRSIFRGVWSVPPGHMLRVRDGALLVEPYWGIDFAVPDPFPLGLDEAAEQLRALLSDATRLRLHADVPVGMYVSGGLDSTTTAALAREHGANLRTFGIGFEDPEYDESDYQALVVQHLGTAHSQVRCAADDIGRAFRHVVWHAEAPLLRTSPAPMYLLAELVHEHGYKVVLTGEGADEVLAGYNIFKEAWVRRGWARQPHSSLRPQLLRRLYPYLPRLSGETGGYLSAFFGQGLSDTDDPLYSHRLRWRNTARCRRFFSADVYAEVGNYDPTADVVATLPAEYGRWSPLGQAQYLESAIFMSEYLLSSQGDRMAMAHSVEGRYPFLDHRVIEFCAQLPPRFKLAGLDEKHILKRAVADLVPDAILRRPKRPYRAPITASLAGKAMPEWVAECLSADAVHRAGYFDPRAVERLLAQSRRGRRLGESDEMALVGIISVQLLDELYVSGRYTTSTLSPADLNVFGGTISVADVATDVATNVATDVAAE